LVRPLSEGSYSAGLISFDVRNPEVAGSTIPRASRVPPPAL